MRFIRAFSWGIILTLWWTQAFAWQVSLQPGTKNATDQVVIKSDLELTQVYTYLVWFDLDAKEKKSMFSSWTWDQTTDQKKWKEGGLPEPVFNSRLNVPKFKEWSVTESKQSCPETHRCFLALVATSAENPLDSQAWQAVSILPLSVAAGQARLPGQQFFLPAENQMNRDFATGADMDNSTTTSEEAPSVAPAADKAEANSSATADVEKPDIFKLVGNQLLYANGQAQRFQVIDLSNFSQPRLVSWIKLEGSPRELYVMDSYYVLLQTDYNSTQGTRLTVLSQGADGQLTTVNELTLSGQFMESRRRNEYIYAVTQDYVTLDTPECMGCSSNVVKVEALHLDSTGQLTVTDKAQAGGYSPRVAIFPDLLVVINDDPNNWISTQIATFDLSQAEGKLVALPLLKVPGRVPSEFHVNATSDQLRVVYGPENREAGSTLAIYNLLSPTLDLLGKVDKIAPGEDLFATRFVNDRAFVVTYERKDPLWVIDLSNANAPKIMGELIVPGWSEKLFFHEDRLFAVGIDDQPAEGEENQWVRRVAMSLFDVADPTKPALLSKFTPLAKQVTYSWSAAIDDERALLLDWEGEFAALPLDSWDLNGGSFLQVVSFAANQLTDAGLLNSPVSLQRSLTIAPEVLAALGDQSIMTVRWGVGVKPEVLGELELASNVTWLKLQDGELWGAGWGNQGYHRFYHYAPTNLEAPVKLWNIPKSYPGVALEENLVVFYDYYNSPMTVQRLDVNTGEVYPLQTLETTPTVVPTTESTTAVTDEAMSIMPPVWYDRSQPLLHKGWFYLAEQRPFDATTNQDMPFLEIPVDTYQTTWVLRSWDLMATVTNEASSRSIPGKPLAFTASGELVTQESSEKGQLRFNLLALEEGNARLVASRELACNYYSQVVWTSDSLYVKCETQDNYGGPIYYLADKVAVKEKPVDIFSEDTIAAPDTGDTVKEESEPMTTLLKLSPAQEFAEIGQWQFKGTRNLQAVSADTALMGPPYYWYGGYGIKNGKRNTRQEEMAMPAIMPPMEDTGCDVYRLTPGTEPQVLKHLDTCPYSAPEAMVLTSNKAWVAEGFAGIREISW